MSSRRMAIDIAGMLRGGQVSNPGSVVGLLSAAVRDIGVTDVVAYLVDFEQLVLEPLPDLATHAALPVAEEVESTMAGRAFRSREPVTVERAGGLRVWVPIVEGSDRTGVLAMTVPTHDDQLLATCADLGLLAGYLIAAHARCTDLYQLHRRRKSMTIEASMQWDLLPPLVLRTEGCCVAGRLEPAYEVGGDCFDYALNGSVLDLALIDAMGHGVTSATIASLVVGAYRHGRREGHSLVGIHATLNALLDRQFAGEAFCTGQLAKLAVDTGELLWTNAGHPSPLLIRNGQVVKELDGPRTLPWGLDADVADVGREALEPGDGVLFYTDGVVEARTPDGDEFGIERLSDMAGKYSSNLLPAEEVVRHLVRSVVDHQSAALRDDATVVLLEWRSATL